jgi:hypothetical protein
MDKTTKKLKLDKLKVKKEFITNLNVADLSKVAGGMPCQFSRTSCSPCPTHSLQYTC